MDTTVGVVVLSAGVGNDVVGWILLALAVALANASTGLVALYVLLTGAGYALFLLFPVKWCYVWLARRTGSFERGSPTSLMMTVTIIMVLFSALFTDIIGIHPIFGGFLAGLVIPHENGYSIALVEKIEDLIGILFLPLVSYVRYHSNKVTNALDRYSTSPSQVCEQIWDCLTTALLGDMSC